MQKKKPGDLKETMPITEPAPNAGMAQGQFRLAF